MASSLAILAVVSSLLGHAALLVLGSASTAVRGAKTLLREMLPSYPGLW